MFEIKLMKLKFRIRPNEELADALRRHLQREPTFGELIACFGGRAVGSSELRPRPLCGEYYDTSAIDKKST